MAVTDLYILPEEVKLLPVKELPLGASDKFEYEADDFVMTFSRGRSTSKVVDASTASLLNTFRKPKSLSEAVFTYAKLNKLDAEQTLEGAYGFLSRLRKEGFLVLYDEASQKSNKILQVGDSFKDYEIVLKLQGVADTEVYKIKKHNQFYALKVLKTNGKSFSLLENFNNEIEILKKLDGIVNPKLIEHGEYDNDNYLIIDWIDGLPSNQAVEKYRNLCDASNVLEITTICYNILKAYAHLHHQGIIHSDIHPRNILVSENGDIRIIDFGLTRTIDNEKLPLRGGVSFFFEPEYALSVINKQPVPASSFFGEQYALAALFYQLFTGKQYLDFSFETDTLFSQIAHTPPTAFMQYDIDIEPIVEKALGKALSKKASDRYPSLEGFSDDFLAARNVLLNHSSKDLKRSFQAFTNSLKETYGFNGNLIENGLQTAPNCSVNFGAAGIAYMFYRMALVEGNAEMLSLADVWADRAASYIHHDKGFYCKEIDITPAIVGETSIYHTASGVNLVQALISREMGDYNNHIKAVNNFISNASKPCENLDLTLGRSATLVGCSLLFENLLPYDPIKQDLLVFGKKIIIQIWDIIDGYAVISENDPINYRGIAHGWAGILYATLKWCNISNQALPSQYFERVNQLALLGIEENDYIRWPVSNTDSSSWTGWCHGSAGYAFLWTSLFHFTNDKKYLHLAEKTVQHFLHFGEAGTNGSLCCGMSGECYALLNIYNVTNKEYYLNEAKRIAKKMLPLIYTGQMRNHSLYKGNIGAGTLFTELNNPTFAKMPLFE